jgi:hypothetical protein
MLPFYIISAFFGLFLVKHVHTLIAIELVIGLCLNYIFASLFR